MDMGSKARGLGIALLFSLLTAVCAPSAHAETTEQRRAAAEALFNEASQLFRDGKYEEACSRLASSQRLDPAPGTLLNLGRCYEKIGKTASAWLAFVDAAAASKSAGQADREKVARDGASRMAPSVPKLALRVSDDVAAVEALQIRRNGEVVPQALWNIASPTDPGDHQIEVTAAGKKPWSTTIRLDPAEQESVRIPALENDPNQPPKTKPGAPSEPAPGSDGLGTHRTIALVSAGVGVIGLGAGAVFGLGAKSDAEKADETCRGATCDDRTGLDANASALRKAKLSTIFFSAGAALLAGGAVLWFTAPSATSERRPVVKSARLRLSPALESGRASVALEGAW